MISDPVTCRAEDTASDAAKAMRAHGIGAVIALDGSRLCGVATDRDLVVRVPADGADPAATPLRDVCSRQVHTLGPDDDVNAAVQMMAADGAAGCGCRERHRGGCPDYRRSRHRAG
jgi:CBS domain-containing protein